MKNDAVPYQIVFDALLHGLNRELLHAAVDGVALRIEVKEFPATVGLITVERQWIEVTVVRLP